MHEPAGTLRSSLLQSRSGEIMGRSPRTFVAGFPHHVVQRGHNRKAVFAEDADFERYLRNLRELRNKFGVRVHGYCLMTNHVHLILAPEKEPEAISLLMKSLAARHTRYVNQTKRRIGTIWSGRFKSSIIDCDEYLLACARYVDMNPVRAGMVTEPGDYPWSSYRQKVGLADEVWLDEDPLYQSLGMTEFERRAKYRNLVSTRIPDQQLALIRNAVNRNQLTGGREFVDEMTRKLGRRIEPRGPGRPRKDIENKSGTFSVRLKTVRK